MSARKQFYLYTFIVYLIIALIHLFWHPIVWALVIVLPLSILGCYDIFQRRKNVLRNYPVWGHWRYILLSIRPMIQQYFINTDQSGRPFNAAQRDLVYTRSEGKLDMQPFGTQLDVHETGFEWVNHSMQPTEPTADCARITVGGPACKQPYSASIYNISAMSFGALSSEAIRALNRGARLNNFYHNTGEGGASKHHLREGGDVVWQIGTGYFGCRSVEGGFDSEKFHEQAQHANIKMIEIKLSQGAKPAHGAVLPGEKVTKEIAEARGVSVGVTVDSPARHRAFSTPLELIQFIQRLRELSDGKPIGFKLCLGNRIDFMAICKAMIKLDIYPDFITIDGCEGGTGAAPVEFTDHIGVPLNEGIIYIHNTLVGCGIRKHIRLIASGKVITGFDLVTKLALGADICNAARGMLFSIGCIQSRRCHTNTCPTGIATQNPELRYALNIDEKSKRVSHFHEETIQSFLQVLGATGLSHASELYPGIIHRRISRDKALTYDEIFPYLEENQIIDGNAPCLYQKFWNAASSDSFVIKTKDARLDD